MQHKIELNHSVLRNNDVVKSIEDIVLNEITLKNLDKELLVHCEDGVIDIFDKLKDLYRSATDQKYVFNPTYGDHLFFVYEGKLSQSTIFDLSTAMKKENTCLTYMRFKNGMVFKVNRRYYPLSGTDVVMCRNTPLSTIFSGSKFVRSAYQQRRHTDTKDIWGMSPEAIRTSIRNVVETLNTDLRMFWYKTNYTPQEAVYIIEQIAECTHSLLCLIEVNHAHTEFRSRVVNADVAIEILDMCIGKFHDGQTAIEFAELAIGMTGKLLEGLVKDNYQNVFRGLLHS